MVRKHINICLVSTVYSFFLYLLINEYDENDIFIFGPNFPKEISKNINHTYFPSIEFTYGIKMAKLGSINGIYQNIRGYALYFYTYIKLRILLFLKTFNKDVEVYGHAQTPFSFMFYENKNSNIIEDGVENYIVNICETHKINKFIDKILHFFGIYFLNIGEAYGSHKNIKNVYLTKKFNHPLIKEKVKIIDIEQTWNNIPEDRKKKILNLFNININLDSTSEIVLILTQPLSDSNLMSLDDELNIYQGFIDKFHDKHIVIKPHPRDHKNYKEIYPESEILDQYFPVELLNLIGIKPLAVCSIVSTSLLNFKDSEIHIYEGELHDEMLIESRKKLLKLLKQ